MDYLVTAEFLEMKSDRR